MSCGVDRIIRQICGNRDRGFHWIAAAQPSRGKQMDRRAFVAAAAAGAAIGAVSQAVAQGAGAQSMHPPKYKALEE